MSESSNAEQLIGVLINKMESMDSNLIFSKRRMTHLSDSSTTRPPSSQMGLVNVSTPFTDDLQVDPFRGDMTLESNTLLKSSPEIGTMSNEDIHAMSWEDIHEMALSAKEATQ